MRKTKTKRRLIDISKYNGMTAKEIIACKDFAHPFYGFYQIECEALEEIMSECLSETFDDAMLEAAQMYIDGVEPEAASKRLRKKYL
jgi:hypothetical protein